MVVGARQSFQFYRQPGFWEILHFLISAIKLYIPQTEGLLPLTGNEPTLCISPSKIAVLHVHPTISLSLYAERILRINNTA